MPVDEDRSGDGPGAAEGWTLRRKVATGALAAFLGVAALLAVLASTTLSLDLADARARVEERLESVAGHPVSVGGEAVFSLLPVPRLSLADVRIESDDPADAFALDIDRVAVDFGILNALIGRVDIERLTLLRPDLQLGMLPADAAGVAEAPASADGAARTQQSRPAAAGPAAPRNDYAKAVARLEFFFRRLEGIGELEIQGGSLTDARERFGFSNADLLLTWPTRQSPADLSGSFVWNGQPTAIDASLERPIDFLDGQPSVLAGRIGSPLLDASFTGSGSAGEAPQLEGDLKLTTASLSRAVRWLAPGGTADVPDFGSLSLETRVRVDGPMLKLDAATIGVDGYVGRGALEAGLASAARQPFVSGTLAFDRLELDGIAGSIAPPPRRAFDLQRPIRLGFIRDLDLDLRVSATDGALGSIAFTGLAATVKSVSGIATVDIGDAAVLGGGAEARLRIDATGTVPTADGRARLSGVGAAGLADLFGVTGLAVTGQADLEAEIRTPVISWGDVLKRHRAEFRLRILDGSVAGFDPLRLLVPGERQLSEAASQASTPFAKALATLSTGGVTAMIDDLEVDAASGRFAASGRLSLADDRLQLGGTFAPSPPMGSAFTASKPLAVTMDGAWPNPRVVVGAAVEPI